MTATQSVRKPSRVYLRRGHPSTRKAAAAWPMFAGAGSALHDISGRQNNLTLVNGDSSNWGTGPFGSIVTFNGTDEHAEADGVDANAQQYSGIFRFRWSAHDDFARVFQVGSHSGEVTDSPASGWSVEFDGSNDALKLVHWDSGQFATVTTTSALSSNAWYTVGVHGNGDNGTIYLFDNDGELSNSPWSGSGTRGGIGSLKLVFFMAGDGNYTTGDADGARIYTREMPNGEVRQQHENPLAPYITKPR